MLKRKKKIKSNKDKIIETIKTEVMKSDREFDISVGDILVEYEDEDYWFYCDEFEVNSVTGVKINDNDIIISEIKRMIREKLTECILRLVVERIYLLEGFISPPRKV